MDMDDYQKFIHLTRYARYLPEEKRRETWEETVDRYVKFFSTHHKSFPAAKIRSAIMQMDVMPSMRALMSAGEALERDNVAGFNCSFLPIDSLRAFDELLYILMCGCGVGFSVERQYVEQLPIIAEEFQNSDTTIVVQDSKIGWARALREYIGILAGGHIPHVDVSRVRPAGVPLKIFGGRASGPGPLKEMLDYISVVFQKAAGRRLNSLECHDVSCKIADSVVVGGVRRSALISLSNLTDDRMRRAKSGQWWVEHGERTLANNSVAYSEPPDIGTFMREWSALYESKSGERGIFNRLAAEHQVTSTGRREPGHPWGVNPCGEVILRPYQFCNLSEVIIRPGDNLKSLLRKVEAATILGTFQSTLTNFRYLRKVWKANCEDERLLGVSFTGICDHEVMGDIAHPDLQTWLVALRKKAIEVNKQWSKKLKIKPAAAITCVKPSGTVSQLVSCSSGIHPAHSPYYIRSVRCDIKDPVAQFLVSQGVICEPDATKPDNTLVLSFPRKSAEGAKTQLKALEQLSLYLEYRRHWCDHNVSITVYVEEHEWLAVGAWVFKHFSEVCGVAFLPSVEHVYKQAPYLAVTKEDFENFKFPEISWGNIPPEDVEGMQQRELACSAGSCEV
jgi:ribonucleoside-diphosphate reductase alpha chain